MELVLAVQINVCSQEQQSTSPLEKMSQVRFSLRHVFSFSCSTLEVTDLAEDPKVLSCGEGIILPFSTVKLPKTIFSILEMVTEMCVRMSRCLSPVPVSSCPPLDGSYTIVRH